MAFKHEFTSDDWFIKKYNDKMISILSKKLHEGLMGEGSIGICNMICFQSVSKDEVIKNAKLISQAPNLVQLVETYYDSLKEGIMKQLCRKVLIDAGVEFETSYNVNDIEVDAEHIKP